MKKLILSTLFLVALGDVGSAQRKGLPTFGQYPAAVERAHARAINFKSSPNARTYRTRLTEALGEGVNFAGHYIVTGWGCGTGCTNAAIIEARTGNVAFPAEFYNIDATYGEGYSDEQLEFKKNSRLLVVHGSPGPPKESGPSKPAGDYYYEWRDGRFRLLKLVKKR